MNINKDRGQKTGLATKTWFLPNLMQKHNLIPVLKILGMIAVLILLSTRPTPARSTWNYNFYFGNPHSHTEYSDGWGTPAYAYDYAKNSGVGHFLAVSDHADMLDLTEWEDTKVQADIYTDANFVSIAAFEFTTTEGDLNIFDTEWFDGPPWTDPPTDIYDYLATERPGSIAQWNHPSSADGGITDYSTYTPDRDTVIQSIEILNRNQIYEARYIEALDFGWHIAPTAGQDNHSGEWLTESEIRTVILATSLTRDNIYEAMRAHRVYATQNRNLEIAYQINDKVMGSIIPTGTCNVSIYVRDPNTGRSSDRISKIELIRNGGVVQETHTVSPLRHEVEWTFSFACNTPRYYFVRVTNSSGQKAWTAPIWVEEIPEHTLTLNQAGSGTLTPGAGTHTYLYGDVVTLQAVANPGWHFAGWSGDLSGLDTPTTLTIDGNKTVTATFSLTPIPITAVDIIFTPEFPMIGQPVSFVATITGGVAPLTYTWNFGDSVQISTQTSTVLHSFPSINTLQTYTVTLTVSDAFNSYQVSEPVSVQPFVVYVPLVFKTSHP